MMTIYVNDVISSNVINLKCSIYSFSSLIVFKQIEILIVFVEETKVTSTDQNQECNIC